MSIANFFLWLALLIVQTLILLDGLALAVNFGIFAILTILGTIRFAVQMKRTEGLSPAECKVLYAPTQYQNMANSKGAVFQQESMLPEEVYTRTSI